MATFQKREYHEDTTEKHTISPEDIQFLLGLQRELNTQPNMGNADPIYWGIMETDEQPACEDYADASVIIDDCGSIAARNLKEFAQHLEDDLPYDIKRIEPEGSGLTFYFENGDEGTAYSLDGAIEILNDNGIEGYRIGYVRQEHKLRTDALFLTHKDCEDHLEKYGYNYKADAHAYAMTACRSPRYEMLLRILKTVDWSRLSQGQEEE